MIKKKNYTCNICNTSWECYIFTEFGMPFGICRYCYIDVENILKKAHQMNGTCNLCDTAKECFKIPLVNNPVKTEMMICRECFFSMRKLIREKDI